MLRLGWYLKRARVMTGRELVHRGRQAVGMAALGIQHRLGVGLAAPSPRPADLAFYKAAEPQLPAQHFDVAALDRVASELLAGSMQIAGRAWRWDGSPNAWYRAPDTGRSWPRGFFGTIPHLQGNPFGEIRLLWEPARLQQLVDLAALAGVASTPDREAAVRLIEAQLTSWVDANPPFGGPHYISAMECALRLMAACHALDMVRAHLSGDSPWHALMRLAGSHAPLIERRLSLHSSTGNHTVAEAGGLVYAGLLFPEMSGSDRWVAKGLSLLTALARSQVMVDGGGAEQAPAYHLFNLQIMTLVNGLLQKLGRPSPGEIADAIVRGSRFLRAIETGNGDLPSIGDGDGGYALSRFLRFPPEVTVNPRHTAHFPESGYTVAQIAATPATRLIFDHGPLGMAPTYGHGHADALSLQVYAAGLPVLIDPGTYTYTGDPELRRYFRSTHAHNTVTVDHHDQARQEGSFLWSRPYRTRVIAAELEDESSGRMLVEHDGYRDLGIRHVRGLAWRCESWLLVVDMLRGEDVHDFELHWHLRSQPTQVDGETYAIAVPDGSWTLRLSGGSITMHSAEKTPIRGWMSRGFGVIEPCHTLRAFFSGAAPHTFETSISLGDHEPPEAWVVNTRKWMQDSSQ